MLPGTVVGTLFVLALVPGFLYLRDTRHHREAMSSLSPIEEFFGLIAFGVGFTAPVAGIGILLASSRLPDALEGPVSAGDIRTLVVGTSGILAGSVGLALLWARRYRSNHPIRSGESSWHDVLLTRGTGALAFASVTTTDQRVIAGSVYSFDGSGKDGPRNIVLSGPLSTFQEGQPIEALDTDRIFLSEETIHSITVSYWDEQSGQRVANFPPPRTRVKKRGNWD